MPLAKRRLLPHGAAETTSPVNKSLAQFLATAGALPLPPHQQQQQQLCDETRAQYDALLRRQEAAHEHQLLAAHRRLQDVLSSHIALTEHEKVLFAEGERHRRELADQTALHARELALLETKWRRKWHKRETELVARCEEETQLALDRLSPLELERNDALRRLKEQEIDELTRSELLREAHRARELAETRLDEACKHLVTLKARIKQLEQRPDTAGGERRAKMAFYDKWQRAALLLAETKGDLGKQLAALEQDLVHARATLADERARHAACQIEVQELRALTRSLETIGVELRAAEQAAAERRAAERAQFEKELDALRAALAARRVKLLRTREQLVAEEKRVHTCDMRVQTLETALATLEQRSSARRHQCQQLRGRVKQLEALVRELQAQHQDEQHDAQLSRLLFGGE
ncbi:hypothetical protein PybrP1_008276 [[Pythium] brassicae (nom. inval.)]|nr:hypothetical protein PybrP1_008276 [[Pythium] brassicae (nom. inval.)]